MARISRKTQTVPQPISSVSWRIALYVRLSVEDNGLTDSDSIENQIEFLREFVDRIDDKTQVSVYIDNGETGTNFERQKWEALIDAVKRREINCIIVKDLSRFARNYIEAGDYLEKIFPFLGVRFIAVNDCYDSSRLLFSENDLTVSLKNLVNDYYAKDISRKVMSAFTTKKKNGEYIGSKAPFGYVLEDNHFVIDPEAAEVVKRIFTLFLEGKSGYAIARLLNEENIPSPSRYAYEKGNRKYCKYKNVIWQQQAVTRILYNETYIGSLVQEKNNKSIYAKERKGLRAEEQWMIIPDAHEAIISRDVFMAVQAVKQKNRNIRKRRCESIKENAHEDILKGYIFCGICGRPIRRNSTVRKGKAEYSYYCATNYNHANAECTTASTSEKKILSVIYQQIRVQMKLAVEVECLLRQFKAVSEKSNLYQSLLQELHMVHDELKRVKMLKFALYEDYKSTSLTKEEYLSAKERHNNQVNELSAKIELLERKKVQYEETRKSCNQWIQTFIQFRDTNMLTRDMMKELVEKVEIFPERRIQVVFRFKEKYESVLQYLANVAEEEKKGQTDAEIFSKIS